MEEEKEGTNNKPKLSKEEMEYWRNLYKTSKPAHIIKFPATESYRAMLAYLKSS